MEIWPSGQVQQKLKKWSRNRADVVMGDWTHALDALIESPDFHRPSRAAGAGVRLDREMVLGAHTANP